MAPPFSAVTPTILGGKSADPALRAWDTIDQAHCDFATGVLGSLSIVALVVAEKPRDELDEFATKTTTDAGATAPKQLAAQIATLLKTQETASRRAIEIARFHGRLPSASEGQGSA